VSDSRMTIEQIIAEHGRPRSSKLSLEQARDICLRAWQGDPPSEIAEDHDVSPATVSSIKHGRVWGLWTEDIRTRYKDSEERYLFGG
jgi:DNA-binding CsgD family transcriptional regulator